MKRIFLFNLIAVILILSLYIVSAEVTVGEYAKYGIINVTTDTIIDTGINLTDFNVIGFVCNSANCAGVSASLWGGNVLHSTGNFIQLVYPTILQSIPFGYGVYLYKDGYIPFEISATWAGTGDAGSFTRYLTKKSSCTATISNFNHQNTTSSIIVNATINAPIHNSGPLDYIPPVILSQYQSIVNANIELKKNNLLVYSETKSLTIDFSGNKDIGFTLPLSGPGNYHVKIYTDNSIKCVLNIQDVREFDLNISIPSCIPSIVNTTWSSWLDIGSCNIFNKQNQSRYKIQYDSNNCGQANTTFHDYQEVDCNYCSEDINSLYTSWSACVNNTQTRTKYFLDYNYNSCCLITGLSSDCHITNGSYSNTTETRSCNTQEEKCTSCGKLKVFGNTSIESSENQTKDISRGVVIGNLTSINLQNQAKTGNSLLALFIVLSLLILLLLLLILLALSRRR